MPEPSQFYTGVVAEAFTALRAVEPDADTYARFIRVFGEPALELGCGTGDPLLELRRRGLDVEGLDASADMLALCRVRADEAGLEVVLHEASFEEMDLGRTYRSVFLAGASFTLLVDDERAGRALSRIGAHLAPGGAALVPLFVPPPAGAASLGTAQSTTLPDGRLISCTTVAVERDDEARRQTTVLRYEVTEDGETTTVEREWVLHWHTQAGFRSLADAAGLTVITVVDASGNPASEDATEFAFLLGL
ncbi:MAG TPA: class I SAM-dependent methyltransferase [Acidimicrobiales bacterium]|nr:class I SAM-dependent methyltransferase [Acidimicrobiales bacterium]